MTQPLNKTQLNLEGGNETFFKLPQVTSLFAVQEAVHCSFLFIQMRDLL